MRLAAKILALILGLVGIVALGLLLYLAYSPEPLPSEPPARDRARAEQILADPRWRAPAGWTFARYERPDGVSLRYGSAPGNPNGAMILPGKTLPTLVYVPGFTSFIERENELLRQASEAGFRVMAVELRGQGGSTRSLPGAKNREKTHLTDFGVYGDDIAAFLDEKVRPDSPGPIVLIGHSLGGHAVMRTALGFPSSADAYVLVAPALGLRNAGMSQSQGIVLAQLVSLVGGSRHYVMGQGPRQWPAERLDGVGECGSDPARAATLGAWFYVKPELRLGGGTYGWVGAFLRSNQAMQRSERMTALDRPFLLISPQRDNLVDPAVSSTICSKLKNCREVPMPTANHCVFHDAEPDFAAARDALFRFAQAQATADATPAKPAPAPALNSNDQSKLPALH